MFKGEPQYFPQSSYDGLEEHTIQTLEDMLRACMNNFNGIWDDYLPLIEFVKIIAITLDYKWILMRFFMGKLDLIWMVGSW